MKIVGIVGPYFDGGDRRLIDHNIADARSVSIRLANYFGESKVVGFFTPHNHTAQFEQLALASESYYHALDETIFDRACDAFILLPMWDTSAGSRRDYNRAREQGKIIFKLGGFDVRSFNILLKQLDDWAKGEKTEIKVDKKEQKQKKKEREDFDKKRRFFFDAGFAYSLPTKIRKAADKLNGKKTTLRKAISKIQAASPNKITIKDDWLVVEIKDGAEVAQVCWIIRFTKPC